MGVVLPYVLMVLPSVLAVVALVWQQARVRQLAQALAASEARRADLVRLARLVASDLRGPSLGLLGQSEQAPDTLKPAMIGVCRFLLDLAEALLEHTEESVPARRLREESVQVGPLVDFAVAQVAAQLGPGRRVWRLSEALQTTVVRADKRALHQVVLRVVTGAALSTRDGDWIEISAGVEDGKWILAVVDEGAGLPNSHAAGSGVETRGLGVGLSLARQLMQAHGGELALESTARVGTRAMVSLPADRLLA